MIGHKVFSVVSPWLFPMLYVKQVLTSKCRHSSLAQGILFHSVRVSKLLDVTENGLHPSILDTLGMGDALLEYFANIKLSTVTLISLTAKRHDRDRLSRAKWDYSTTAVIGR